MATAGSIVVDLLMRTGSFETDTNRAGKSMKKLGKDAGDSAADVGKAFGKIAGAVVGATAVAGTAVLGWTRQLIDASTELERFARLSGTNEQVFQRMAAGAATVGIQQDKLADIFKDTQDKLGDFLSTGGGAMADFFEQIAPKVNLTADAFRNLSGPEVLQKYYKALEDAGASQADMVFYMEAIASDSAVLAPLLANNSEGFRRWGSEAERLGAVLDARTIASLKQVKQQSQEVSLAFTGLRNEVATEMLPQFRELTEFLGSEQTKSAFIEISKLVASLAAQMADGAVLIANYVSQWSKVQRIDWGAELSGANEESLNAAMVNLSQRIAKERRGTAAQQMFDLSLTERQLTKINELERERTRIQRELTRRYKPQAVLIDDGQSLPDSALRDPARSSAAAAGTFRATAASKEGEGAARKLADAIKSANEQLQRQIVLYGDASELSKISYEIQFGGLRGIDSAAQAALKSSASLLDMLGNIDEAEAIMAESAQQFADAFDSMFGVDDDSPVESYFGQMSVFADQAARNMQDSFAEFLFDPFAEGLGGMVKGFAKAIQRMLAEAAASELFQMVGTWASSYSGAGSGWVNAIGGAIGGTAGNRAGGGPVAAGSIYRVGEGGRPELFDQGGKRYLIPGESGSVTPITSGMAFGGAGGAGVTNQFSSTLHVSADRNSATQSGSGSSDAQALKRSFDAAITQWAVQQSRPGGFLYRMGTGNG